MADKDESLNDREVLLYLSNRISAADWRELGTNLGLSRDLLRTIYADNRGVRSMLREVVENWLQHNYKPEVYGYPSWTRLDEAIKQLTAQKR